MLDRIVVETNRYACQELLRKPGTPACIKERPNWMDVNRVDIRGWIGICIMMGVMRYALLEA